MLHSELATLLSPALPEEGVYRLLYIFRKCESIDGEVRYLLAQTF